MSDSFNSWFNGQQTGTVVGFPPLASPPSLSHNPRQFPFKGTPDSGLAPDQLAIRQQWIEDERSRLVAEKQRSAPMNTQTVAAELTRRLAARDRSLWG